MARADSGFCNSGFMNACSAKGVGFVVAGRLGGKLEDAVKRIKIWSEGDFKVRDGRPAELGSCSVAGFGGYKQHLRIVSLRARRKDDGRACLFEEDLYDYYFFVTNMGQHEMSNEDLIYFYRERGHAENFIREQKNGFDLKHYPCQKLSANKAFGLIAGLSYTLMRSMALLSPREKQTKVGVKKIVQFSKATRRKWLFIPIQVVHHAGELIFRYSTHHFKEVSHWLSQINYIEFGRS